MRRSGDGSCVRRALRALRRCARRPGPARPGRARRRRGAGRRPAHRAGLGDRIDGDGPRVGPRVAQRFGRVLLELGGNNATIVCPSADLELAARAILFSAAGTAGQRCTTLRRLIVHESIADELVERLKQLVRRCERSATRATAGHARRSADRRSGVQCHEGTCSASAIERVDAVPGGYYVRPAIVEVEAQEGTVLQETFAPILYVLRYRELDEAIALNNGVTQGLSSSIFTNDVREAERFMSACGLRLRDRQRQHRPFGRRDRRRVRRREGNRRRARKRLGRAGAPTCGARPTRSITAASYRSPRASASTSPHSASGSSVIIFGQARRNASLPGLQRVGLDRRRDRDSPARGRSRAPQPRAAARASRRPRRSRSGRGHAQGR